MITPDLDYIGETEPTDRELSEERRAIARHVRMAIDQGCLVVVDTSLPDDDIWVGAPLANFRAPGVVGDELTVTVGSQAFLDYLIAVWTLADDLEAHLWLTLFEAADRMGLAWPT